MIRVTIWNENIDETAGVQEVLAVHPNGIHNTLKDIITALGDAVQVTAVTMQQPAFGLPDSLLEQTDVLVWWEHRAQQALPDELIRRIHRRVLAGMGLILLHSASLSKVFRLVLGTSGDMKWRHDAYERLFCVDPAHPIAYGVPEIIELGIDECYSEFFDIPKPDELIFLGWFETGHVLRCGCTWSRGYGKVFYFQPGHETNRAFHHPEVKTIIRNAVVWAAPCCYRSKEGCEHIDITPEAQRLHGQ